MIDLDFDDVAAEKLVDNAIRKAMPEFDFEQYNKERDEGDYEGMHHKIYRAFHQIVLKILKAINYKKASY